jgi:DedD protein
MRLIGGFKVSDFPIDDINALEIKKRARRRLVGAAVLALLAVVVLPQLLNDSEAPRPVPDMQVSIPGHDEPELPLDASENDPGAESARVDIEPDAATDVPGFPAEAPSAPPEPAPQPAPYLAPPVAEQPAPPPSIAQPSREPRKDNTPPRPHAAPKEAEAARALALLSGENPGKGAGKNEKAVREASGARGRVFIQVGAFGNVKGATRQAEELKKLGFAAYTEKAGRVTRVRIGPLSRSEGEDAVARLKAQGHNAVLSAR